MYIFARRAAFERDLDRILSKGRSRLVEMKGKGVKNVPSRAEACCEGQEGEVSSRVHGGIERLAWKR